MFLLLGGGSIFADEVTKVLLSDLTAASGGQTTWNNSIANVKTLPCDVKDDVIFGNDGNDGSSNANIDAYEYLYVTVTDFTKARAIRIFLWDPNANKRLDYYLYPEEEKETAVYTTQKEITANGTYCVKIPEGARLQGAKAPWTSTTATEPYFKFAEIYLTKRAKAYVPIKPYTLSYVENKAEIPFDEQHIRATGSLTIDYENKSITSTGSGQLTIYLNNEDLTGAQLYHVDTEGDDIFQSMDIIDKVNGSLSAVYGSKYNWNIETDAQRNTKAGSVTSLVYNTSNTQGTITFKSIYVLANHITVPKAERSITELPFNEWDATADKIGNKVGDAKYYANNLGKKINNTIYGFDGNADANKYIDLSNCSKLIFKGYSTNGAIRLFYNWDGTDTNKPIETISGFPKEDGEYTLDITAFKKKKNLKFFHLIGIKSQWADVAIESITAVYNNNILTGSGIMTEEAKDLLADQTVTSIDATGLTNTKAITLTPANPNCIIVAAEGKLANEKNVAVNNTVADLVLTDGYSFKAPEGLTAANAQYERAMTTKFGTITLPFDAKSNETVQFYTVNGKTDNSIELTEVDELAAGTPAIMQQKGDKVSIKATAVAVSNEIKEAAGAVTMHGSYTMDTKVTDANAYYIYNDKFWKRADVADDPHFFCDAFRAYFTVDGAAAAQAKALTINAGGNPTGMNAVEELTNNGIEAVYNTAGVKQNDIQKGVNIVRLANGKTITVIVK